MTLSTIPATPMAALPHREDDAASIEAPAVTARAWFARGGRVPYDRRAKRILGPDETVTSADLVDVFRRIENATGRDENAMWTSFLPGWPDGSFGWAKTARHLTGDLGPKLFVEYVGHGESDKPADYRYSTMERANLVEALWAAEGVRSSFVVTFDYSSIVALELLSRQQDRIERGAEPATRIEGVLLVNGGLFADAHSHPWFTTPVLKSRFGGVVTRMAQRSRFAFGQLLKPLWSNDYGVTRGELDEIYDAMGRRDGVAILSESAGFVDEHKRKADRWDLGRLFRASRETVAFHVVGSEQDPFEWKQVVKARERLGGEGLDVRVLPGGHMTTSEHPELLARIIREVAAKQPSDRQSARDGA